MAVYLDIYDAGGTKVVDGSEMTQLGSTESYTFDYLKPASQGTFHYIVYDETDATLDFGSFTVGPLGGGGIYWEKIDEGLRTKIDEIKKDSEEKTKLLLEFLDKYNSLRNRIEEVVGELKVDASVGEKLSGLGSKMDEFTEKIKQVSSQSYEAHFTKLSEEIKTLQTKEEQLALLQKDLNLVSKFVAEGFIRVNDLLLRQDFDSTVSKRLDPVLKELNLMHDRLEKTTTFMDLDSSTNKIVKQVIDSEIILPDTFKVDPSQMSKFETQVQAYADTSYEQLKILEDKFGALLQSSEKLNEINQSLELAKEKLNALSGEMDVDRNMNLGRFKEYIAKLNEGLDEVNAKEDLENIKRNVGELLDQAQKGTTRKDLNLTEFAIRDKLLELEKQINDQITNVKDSVGVAKEIFKLGLEETRHTVRKDLAKIKKGIDDVDLNTQLKLLNLDVDKIEND